MKKKIAFFNGYFLPHLGGVERYTYSIAKKMIDKGFEVIVVTSRHDESLSSIEIVDGIKVYRLPIKNIWKNRYPFLKINLEYRKLIFKIREEKIDFFVVNTRFYSTSLLGAKLAAESKKQAFVIEHGSSYLTLNQPILDYFLRKIEKLLICNIFRDTELFYGVSKEAADWLKEFNIIAKGVLYNSVELEDLQKFPQTKSIDKIIISYSGRLQPKIKGVEILVSAFDILAKERNDIELVLAGDGPLFEPLKKKYEDNNRIKFLGFINHEEVMRLEARSDIFVLMSRSEGFSTSMLEAGLLGNVIVTTPTVGGAKDIIPDETFGYIIDNSEVELLKTLRKILAQKENIRLIQRKVSTRIRENFTWEQAAIQFEKVLNDNFGTGTGNE